MRRVNLSRSRLLTVSEETTTGDARPHARSKPTRSSGNSLPCETRRQPKPFPLPSSKFPSFISKQFTNPLQHRRVPSQKTTTNHPQTPNLRSLHTYLFHDDGLLSLSLSPRNPKYIHTSASLFFLSAPVQSILASLEGDFPTDARDGTSLA